MAEVTLFQYCFHAYKDVFFPLMYNTIFPVVIYSPIHNPARFKAGRLVSKRVDPIHNGKKLVTGFKAARPGSF